MSHEKDDLRKFLVVLASTINRCEEEFKGQTVGNSLYSLSNMKSDSPEVKVYLHICMCILYISTRIFIYICIHINVCIYVFIHIYIYTYIYIYSYLYM
jgi:hypothetical protein